MSRPRRSVFTPGIRFALMDKQVLPRNCMPMAATAARLCLWVVVVLPAPDMGIAHGRADILVRLREVHEKAK